MLSQVLAYVNATVVAVAVAFVVGVVFSQKIKDWFNGVPAEVRTGLDDIEATVLGHLTSTTKSVVQSVQAAIPTAPAVAPVVAAPVAPVVAPVAPVASPVAPVVAPVVAPAA